MAWGTNPYQQNQSEGSNDYLVVQVGAPRRVRVLLFGDQQPLSVPQHKITKVNADETETMRSYVCPGNCKFDNNRANAPVSFRNVINVWSYDDGAVKKFAFGNKLKDQLEALHFTSGHLSGYDVMISKVGTGRETNWFAAPVMGSQPGLPAGCSEEAIPWDLYNLPEFQPTPEDQIRRELADIGIDFDAITTPKIYTLEEALAFKLPFSKHKGKTLHEVFTIDTGWITWAANNARMADLKGMCQTIQNQLISGGTAVVSQPPAQTPVQSTVQPTTVTPPVTPTQPAQTTTPTTPTTASPAPEQSLPTPPTPPTNNAQSREEKLAAIDKVIRENPEFKNYQRVVEVMREVTNPNPSFDLRAYTDAQLDALLAKAIGK